MRATKPTSGPEDAGLRFLFLLWFLFAGVAAANDGVDLSPRASGRALRIAEFDVRKA